MNVIDRKHKDEVAIKIIRNIKRYLRSAEIESDLLGNVCSAVKKSKQDIADATSSGSTSYDTVADPKFQNRHKFVVKLYSSFYFRGHFCMVQEPLGVSLYDLVKRNKYAGFPLQTVRHIAFQLFSAVRVVFVGSVMLYCVLFTLLIHVLYIYSCPTFTM